MGKMKKIIHVLSIYPNNMILSKNWLVGHHLLLWDFEPYDIIYITM